MGGREGVSGEGRALQNPRTAERTRPVREWGGRRCPPGAERARLGGARIHLVEGDVTWRGRE